MTITFIGHGYVGLVTACVFADLGNTVHVIGRSPEKIAKLKNGDPIIFEPGLEELLQKNIAAKRIIFDLDYKEAVSQSEIVFLAVGTPPKENGEADLTEVLKVAENIAKNLSKPYTVVSCKSTVPVGTNRKIYDILKANAPAGVRFDVASCPEFLREGSALGDTFNPDRIIIGSDSDEAAKVLLKLHEPLQGERMVVGLESAEIIKYASNSMLSTKISFANLIALICEKAGANVEEVLDGVGVDKRIGRSFLYSGIGYGGSCFPKDVLALIKIGEAMGIDMTLLTSVDTLNKEMRSHFAEKIRSNATGKNFGVWGITFKPNTDDIRFAPSIDVMNNLMGKGGPSATSDGNFTFTAYDPEGMDNAKVVMGETINYAADPYAAIEGKDGLIIFTEWNEFKQIDLAKVKSLLKTPLILDGRNMYDPKEMEKLGFTYISIGR